MSTPSARPSRKRKLPAGAAPEEAKQQKKRVSRKKKNAEFEATPMPNGRSLILELPQELRDLVYDMVLEDTPPRLSRNAHKKLATTSGLLRANKQIHAELSDHMPTSTAPIHTRVLNYDFGHVITFYNRLSENKLKKMMPDAKKEEETAKRGLEVELVFTDDRSTTNGYHGYSHYYDRDKPYKAAERWLNRADCTEKKGVEVEVRYACSYRVAWSWAWGPLDVALGGRQLGSRSHAEGIKIRTILDTAAQAANNS